MRRLHLIILVVLIISALPGCTFIGGPFFIQVDWPGNAGGMVATQEGTPLAEWTPAPTAVPLPTMTPTPSVTPEPAICLVVVKEESGINLREKPAINANKVGGVIWGEFVPVDQFAESGQYLWAHNFNVEGWFVVRERNTWWVNVPAECSGVPGLT